MKDSDSYFLLNKNFNLKIKILLAGVDISEHPEVHNIHQKSFLRQTNKKQIIDIEERKSFQTKFVLVFTPLVQHKILSNIIKTAQKTLKIKKYI